MGADRSLAELAAVQHGLVTGAQADEHGLSRIEIRERLHAGRFRALHPGVYVVGGAPDTWHQRMLGACMAAGGFAVASHRSAARLWGLLAEDDLVELSVLRPKGPRRQVRCGTDRATWCRGTPRCGSGSRSPTRCAPSSTWGRW